MAGRLLAFFEKQYLRSIMFYVIHSFRTRGIWPSIKIWAGEVSHCWCSNDRFWLSRPLFDHPNATLGEGNNPFQASYFSIAREALSIVREQEDAVSFCDVGAGNGRVAKIALDLGFLDVWGVEIDERWKKALRALHEQSNGQFNFIIGDALKTMPQREFDVIFLFNPMSQKVFDVAP